MKLQRRTVLIAGGSTGIGRAVARQLAGAGNTVVITGRRVELLEESAAAINAAGGGRCVPLAGDAADAEATAALIQRAIADVGPIDVALLNIGAGPVANMGRVTVAEVNDAMALNYTTTVNYLVPLIAHLKERGQGVIVHTNSLAGLLPLPMQGPYSASKAAVRVLMDTARTELRDTGIRFVSVYPGFVATDRREGDGVPSPFELSEDEAAAHIIRAIESGKDDVLFPWQTATAVRAVRLLPKRLAGRILMRVVPAEY